MLTSPPRTRVSIATRFSPDGSPLDDRVFTAIE